MEYLSCGIYLGTKMHLVDKAELSSKEEYPHKLVHVDITHQ